MAKSFKLPTMKVRRGCTKGKSTFKSISRGSMRLKRSLPYNFAVEKAKKMELHNEDHDVDDVNYDDDTDEWGSMDETIFRGVTSTHENLPSLYSVKQKVASDSWKAMREAIRNVCVEGAALHMVSCVLSACRMKPLYGVCVVVHQRIIVMTVG